MNVIILAALMQACCHRRQTDKRSLYGRCRKGSRRRTGQDEEQNWLAEKELKKVKNKTESTIAFEDMSVMNRANSLAMYELLGDASLMNTELEKYLR